MLKKLYCILIISSTLNCFASTNLYLFKNQSYLGDNDQLQGAADSIVQNFAQHGITIKQIETYESNMPIEKNSIALFSSVDGVNKWHAIKNKTKSTFGVFLTHQWWNNLFPTFSNNDKFNLIVAPQYSITPLIQESAVKNHVQILGVNGVCSSLQRNDLMKAYESSTINKNQAYTVVLLAGDTQDVDGKWKLFDEKDAIQLAKVIAKHYSQTKQTILVTNGPRTGKIDPKTNQSTNAHKTTDIDSISKIFLAELSKNIPKSKIQFYNFEYGKPSILSAAMGAVLLNKNSSFYVPGESISTASQAISLLPTSSIILYTHHAMLDSHKTYVTQELKLGCAALIDESGNSLIPTQQPNPICSINQCYEAANKIYDLWQKKNL